MLATYRKPGIQSRTPAGVAGTQAQQPLPLPLRVSLAGGQSQESNPGTRRGTPVFYSSPLQDTFSHLASFSMHFWKNCYTSSKLLALDSPSYTVSHFIDTNFTELGGTWHNMVAACALQSPLPVYQTWLLASNRSVILLS